MNPPSTPQPSDAEVRRLLIHRAISAAAELADPTSPESQTYLRAILAADPAKVREKLAAG